MNWEAIGAIGEIVGAAAVVVSLGYLALQIRVQNREAQHAAMHEISVAFRESLGGINREFADVLSRANKDWDSLSEADVMILMARVQQVFRVWEEAFHQHKAGRLESYIWEALTNQYAALLGSPGANKAWELRKDFFEPQFRAFVEKIDVIPLQYR